MTPTTDDLNRNEKRGIDSTDEEREKDTQEQLIFLSKIKELDPVKYDILKKVL